MNADDFIYWTFFCPAQQVRMADVKSRPVECVHTYWGWKPEITCLSLSDLFHYFQCRQLHPVLHYDVFSEVGEVIIEQSWGWFLFSPLKDKLSFFSLSESTRLQWRHQLSVCVCWTWQKQGLRRQMKGMRPLLLVNLCSVLKRVSENSPWEVDKPFGSHLSLKGKNSNVYIMSVSKPEDWKFRPQRGCLMSVCMLFVWQFRARGKINLYIF